MQGRLHLMSAPRKFDREFRDRALRLYRERLQQHDESKLGARRHVGVLLDVNPATLQNWVARPKTAKLATNDRLRDYVQERLSGSVTDADGRPILGPNVP